MIDPTFHAPLGSVYLCPECEQVGVDASRCWSCANTAGLLNLAAVLNRQPDAASEKELILSLHQWCSRGIITDDSPNGRNE